MPQGVAPVMTPVFAREHLVVSGSLGHGFFAHVWTAPSVAGGQCKLIMLDRQARPTRPRGLPNGGMSCSVGRTLPVSNPTGAHPFRFIFSPSHRLVGGGRVPSFVSGKIAATAPVERVVVRWRGGSHALTLHGESFVGGSPAMDMKTGYTLVAYDDRGREIARQPFR
jgi:hypothetical protein